MLSIGKCREILGEDADDLTDQELEEIRDELYALGEMALEEYIKTKTKPSNNYS